MGGRLPLRYALSVALLVSSPALADKAMVRVLSTSEVSSDRQRRLATAAEVALKELSGFEVVESVGTAVTPPPEGAKKGCVQDVACATEVAKSAGGDEVLVLSARVSGGQLVLEGQLVDVAHGRAVPSRVKEGNPSEPEVAVKGLVEAILPPWARKGWGGLSIAKDADTVKVDGQLVSDRDKKNVLPLPSGTHDVDVLLPDGKAVLQRLSVREGSRTDIAPSALPNAEFATAGEPVVGPLRYAGYGTWTAGVLCVAGSFVAGALSKQAVRDVRPCVGGDRTCTAYGDAASAQARSQSYAKTANVLLGTGLGLSAVGIGLVTFDLVKK